MYFFKLKHLNNRLLASNRYINKISKRGYSMQYLLSLFFMMMSCNVALSKVEEKIVNEPQSIDERLFDDDLKVRALLNKHKIPSLSIGVIESGKLQQIRVFGSKENIIKPSTNSFYNVASLTKPIVAMVVLKLVDKGLWNLDGPLSKYYIDEDLKNDATVHDLTTRHVLSHQSGFANWRRLSKDKKLMFDFPPGMQYQYSGEGFEFLRKAIEEKFNKPFEDIAAAELFKPLKMNDTYFYWTNEINQERYQLEHDKAGKPIKYKQHKSANAADNLLTTVEDYSKFMVHILDGGGISKDLYEEMISKQVSVKKGVSFSLGWELFTDLGPWENTNEFALQHTGADTGVRAIAVILPNSNRGLVILSNSENAGNLWPKILMEYFGEVGEKLITANMQ